MIHPQDDEYQTSYGDQPVDEHGVQQEEAPEGEEEAVGREEQQEEEEEDAAEGSQGFDTEEVCRDPPHKTLRFLLLCINVFFSESAAGQLRASW